mmetsp:Transcript_55786/g.105040  ORF Transcript_55786/g.105040 Transcript_55786/m.105040 type:complete len:90 (-) Transcript_55786:574-843(-)
MSLQKLGAGVPEARLDDDPLDTKRSPLWFVAVDLGERAGDAAGVVLPESLTREADGERDMRPTGDRAGDGEGLGEPFGTRCLGDHLDGV